MGRTGTASLRLDMSSLDIAASSPIRGDETVQLSSLLAFVGCCTTKVIAHLALGLPVVALLIVLFRCEMRSDEERA
jgi:hypothetical protein